MTEQQLPEFIVPMKLARRGQSLKGQLPFMAMARLMPLVVNTEGFVSVEVLFGFDGAGVPYMRGHVSGGLDVNCQRCMDVMSLPLELDVSIGFALNEEQVQRMSADYEACVLEEEQVSLIELIEDDILLSLPIVPMHDDENCQQWLVENRKVIDEVDALASEKKNPFAVLSGLKNK